MALTGIFSEYHTGAKPLYQVFYKYLLTTNAV